MQEERSRLGLHRGRCKVVVVRRCASAKEANVSMSLPPFLHSTSNIFKGASKCKRIVEKRRRELARFLRDFSYRGPRIFKAVAVQGLSAPTSQHQQLNRACPTARDRVRLLLRLYYCKRTPCLIEKGTSTCQPAKPCLAARLTGSLPYTPALRQSVSAQKLRCVILGRECQRLEGHGVEYVWPDPEPLRGRRCHARGLI